MASFGDNLRRERELRGITLREISETTKISVRFLQALE
ncbi:MAG TPA: helix-turn-helix domain-containing protein, partial [Vicinamibacteria bacterium]